jgi:hypothetical protein
MADLEGGLLELRPAHLLEFLAATEKTGTLRVAGHQHTLTVWVVDGAAVSAESNGPDEDLLDQLVDLLRTPAGTFKFAEGVRGEAGGEPDRHLLPRAVERLRQWEALADAVPSLSLHVKLLNADDEDVALSSAAWSVSVAVSGGHASVASVAKHLKWSTFKTCTAVRELVDNGRAALVPPPNRRRRGLGSSNSNTNSRVEAPAATPGVWHPANQPLWPGAGTKERDRFSSAWAFEE